VNVSLSREAVADAQQVIDWYVDQQAAPAAAAFHDELGRALARVGNEPGLGTPDPAGTRILPLHRSPYSLVYKLAGQEVRVIAVAAQRRRPGFWSRRR
jgi:plasmid stabilization system protein ParE